MKKVYLATPYTGTPEQQKERFDQACLIAGEIIQQGHCVFSPIAHSHPIAEICGIDGTHDFWKDQNESWLSWCDEVWVAEIPGRQKSKGVQWEISWAHKHGKRVRFMGGI